MSIPINNRETETGLVELDIAPYALPNCPRGEIRWEEPRDISRLILRYDGEVPHDVKLLYQRNSWPRKRVENDYKGVNNAMLFGWTPIDDWFNTSFVEAAIELQPLDANTLQVTFSPLTAELADYADYDVTFRRTIGLRVEGSKPPDSVQVYTRWEPVVTELEVWLDCGKATPGASVCLSGYNAVIENVEPVIGVIVEGPCVTGTADQRAFRAKVRHVKPNLEYSFDVGLVSFSLEHDRFTISLRSLEEQGPIYYEEEGVFIKRASDTTTFEEYLKSIEGAKTYNERVAETWDQSLGGALYGQARGHSVPNSVGCKYARQRFWIEPSGDIVMIGENVKSFPGADTPRYKNERDGRISFSLEKWRSLGRFADPAPVLAHNLHFAKGGVVVRQKSLAVPLEKGAGDALKADDTIVALVRFQIANEGLKNELVEIPVRYSSSSQRSQNRLLLSHWKKDWSDDLIPICPLADLKVSSHASAPSLCLVSSEFEGQDALRFAIDTSMEIAKTDDGLVIRKELKPGESCQAVLKLPFIALDRDDEIAALDRLSFEESLEKVREFWVKECSAGAQVHTPEAKIDDLHATHVAHIQSAGVAMPDDPYLVNTSVGTSTYGNFANESCMILQDLDERGLHEEVRRRIGVWLKYQGTKPLKGNFTDHDGVFFGAGGFECGDTYSQHHGWVLWYIAEHYFMTGDKEWLTKVAGHLVKGADWVFRQRRNTMTDLPHSRGWEYGFMPAGSLEDVADYFYWLTTNAMTWKGVDNVAAALEDIAHPDAERIRVEADAFKKDLIKGFETARQHSPIVRLRNGKWIPHYPSRLYLRGRDVGWIREVLEGSIYLLISGLYDPNSKQGQWIVDDFQDNRYVSDNYGYPIYHPERHWYDSAGFCCQPNLLPGLMPHLDRDEPEIYIWMFFNAWASCYREETNAMVEHPMPILGYANSAWIKTSDQSNAMKWLRYMFVYAPREELYIGRAVPTHWLSSRQPVGVVRAATRFGYIDALYTGDLKNNSITLDATLQLRADPKRIVAKFRHPEKVPIKRVNVNGRPYSKFEADKSEVDLTGFSGKLQVQAYF